MTSIARIALLALVIPLLLNPQWFAFLSADTTGYYSAASVAILVLVLGLVAASHLPARAHFASLGRFERPVLVVFPYVLLLLLGFVIANFLMAFRNDPIDVMKADMLPVIGEATKIFLSGKNPYALYPDLASWKIRLGYGPILWMPYLSTTALNIDPRFLTTACMALVAAFMLTQCLGVAQRQGLALALPLTGLVLVTFSTKLILRFIVIGHTQVYWPLLVLLCVAIEKEWFYRAAMVLGLLASARTTLLSLIPIYLIYVFTRNKRQVLQSLLWVFIGIAAPILPFAWMDYHALYEGLVRNYLVVKPQIWSSPGIYKTFGVVSYLLKNGLGMYQPYIQGLAMALVYVGAMVFVRRKEQVLPWMGLALLVFSMTVFWPVGYLFLDVLILLCLAVIPMVQSTNSVISNHPSEPTVVPGQPSAGS